MPPLRPLSILRPSHATALVFPSRTSIPHLSFSTSPLFQGQRSRQPKSKGLTIHRHFARDTPSPVEGTSPLIPLSQSPNSSRPDSERDAAFSRTGESLIRRPALILPRSDTQTPPSHSSAMAPPSAESLDRLATFSPPDISDALLKLYPSDIRAGYIPDVIPRTSTLTSTPRKVVGLASTMLFGSKHPPPQSYTPLPWSTSSSSESSTLSAEIETNIPKGEQWSDLTPPGSVLLISQPEWHTCACIGGHHITRLAHLGVKGVVVSGRIRDISQAKASGLPIWSRGLSTVGAGAETVPLAVGIEVVVSGVSVKPGWVVMADEEEEGVVVFDGSDRRVEKVLEFLERHVEVEGRVAQAVARGESVKEAFKLRKG